MRKHHYRSQVSWEGNLGSGTSSYHGYSRDHRIMGAGKEHSISGSSDPSFSGNRERYNPEELFIASLSSCHMLWYLHLCSSSNIRVISYFDQPEGIMTENANGSGQFESVTLHPQVTIDRHSDRSLALELHGEAAKMCFIANSCNFRIEHSPQITVQDTPEKPR